MNLILTAVEFVIKLIMKGMRVSEERQARIVGAIRKYRSDPSPEKSYEDVKDQKKKLDKGEIDKG